MALYPDGEGGDFQFGNVFLLVFTPRPIQILREDDYSSSRYSSTLIKQPVTSRETFDAHYA